MTGIRPAAVAGMFYPASAEELNQTLDDLLRPSASAREPPKALIVPHAGYVYSGPVAASAYNLLAPMATQIQRVVLLGPAHRVSVRGLAASSARYWETPLGRVPLDRAALDSLGELAQVHTVDDAHALEHSLEVQLPFLQRVLTSFALVPLVVGRATPEEVQQVLDRLWGGDETLVIVSSDLSHYLDYDSARRRDARTGDAILRLQESEIDFDDACGCIPVQGLLRSARAHGLQARVLDMRNSGDTAGPRDRVVGYGTYAFG